MRTQITPWIERVSSPMPGEWVEWERPEFDRCTAHGCELAGIVHAVGPKIEGMAIGSVWHVLTNRFSDDSDIPRPISPCYPEEEKGDR